MASESKATETTRLNTTSPTLYFLPKKSPSTSAVEIELQSSGSQRRNKEKASGGGSWFFGLFGGNTRNGYQEITDQSKLEAIPRKIPVKIEPKVFFANERTFLAWLHMSVTLASISLAIVAFADANEWSQLYGMLLMPVAIAFCIYSLWMYMKRARMIRRKDPGPYDDDFGPVVLAWMLAIAIIVNFFIKLYDLAT